MDRKYRYMDRRNDYIKKGSWLDKKTTKVRDR